MIIEKETRDTIQLYSGMLEPVLRELNAKAADVPLPIHCTALAQALSDPLTACVIAGANTIGIPLQEAKAAALLMVAAGLDSAIAAISGPKQGEAVH